MFLLYNLRPWIRMQKSDHRLAIRLTSHTDKAVTAQMEHWQIMINIGTHTIEQCHSRGSMSNRNGRPKLIGFSMQIAVANKGHSLWCRT